MPSHLACPRCKKAHSYELKFNFKTGKERINLTARCCKVCNFMWADEKEHLDAIKKHLKWMSTSNGQSS